MVEEHSTIELTVPPADVDEAVARVCDEWGVAREAVKVDQLDPAPNTPPDRVLLRITLLTPDTDSGFDERRETGARRSDAKWRNANGTRYRADALKCEGRQSAIDRRPRKSLRSFQCSWEGYDAPVGGTARGAERILEI